ncbi:hypothetical protein LXL04_017943 [Taraxacum kok-saghyz]
MGIVFFCDVAQRAKGAVDIEAHLVSKEKRPRQMVLGMEMGGEGAGSVIPVPVPEFLTLSPSPSPSPTDAAGAGRGGDWYIRPLPVPGFSLAVIPISIPDTHFFGDYPAPIGAGRPGSPLDRIKFPCLNGTHGLYTGLSTLSPCFFEDPAWPSTYVSPHISLWPSYLLFSPDFIVARTPVDKSSSTQRASSIAASSGRCRNEDASKLQLFVEGGILVHGCFDDEFGSPALEIDGGDDDGCRQLRRMTENISGDVGEIAQLKMLVKSFVRRG